MKTFFTDNEVMTLVDILDAVATGTVTPNHRGSARGLVPRFRGGTEPVIPEGAAASETVLIDPATIFAKRRAVREAAAAAHMARMPGGAR
jgi:hypothetical protein